MRQEKDDLGFIFQALSAPVRRKILDQLATGDANVSELAEPHDMTLAAISRHVRVLTSAQLIHQHRDGKNIRCSLNPDGLISVNKWLQHYQSFWEQKLDSLQWVLESDDES